MRRKFVILDEVYPEKGKIRDDIEWLCRVLGISTPRDKTGIPVRIFEELLKKRIVDEEELANKLGVSRTTVSHHMEKMIFMGIVRKNKTSYMLAGNSLEEMLEDMKSEVILTLSRIQKIAREIDKNFNLIGRI